MPTTDGSHETNTRRSRRHATEQLAPLFAEIRVRFDAESAAVRDETTLKQFRDAWLGRKSGVLAGITDNWLKPATPELKRAVGAGLNQLRAHVDAQVEARRVAIESGAQVAAGAKDRVDLSLPGVVRPIGSRHLIRQVFQEIEDIFVSIGFSVVEGPEIETPYYNFAALNIPEFHPVRDDMDYFLCRGARRGRNQNRAGITAAAHTHFARSDSHHGRAATSGARDCSWQGVSPR